MRRRASRFWVLSSLLIAACATHEQTEEDCEHALCESSTAVGCPGWVEATCAYMARCGDAPEDCLQTLSSIVCRSESAVDRCVVELEHARCGAPPYECTPEAVADTAGAVSGCVAFRMRVCESAVACKLDANVAACVAEAPLPCERAVALSPSYARCMSELEQLECRAWVPPYACLGAVVVAEP